MWSIKLLQIGVVMLLGLVKKVFLEMLQSYFRYANHLILNNQKELPMLEEPPLQRNQPCFQPLPIDPHDFQDLFHDESLCEDSRALDEIPVARCPSFQTCIGSEGEEGDYPPSALQFGHEIKDAGSSEAGEREEQRDAGERYGRSKHNIFGYVAKSAIRMMLKKYKLKIMKEGKRHHFTFKDFEQAFGAKGNYMYGPEGFKKLFEGSTKRNMARLFWRLFESVLRKDYIVYAGCKGKMKELEMYVETKNRHLLYVQELMEHMREQTEV